MKLTILLLMASGLWAQDAKTVGDGPVAKVQAVQQDATVDSLKARIVWLEQKLAVTEAKLAALAQFYAAQEQLQGLAAKEPKVETTK